MPTHEQKPIKLFDIREFVKKKKDEKRNELFGGASPFGGSSPFGGTSPFGSSPFGGGSNASPFGGINHQDNNNPLAAYGANQNNTSFPSFGNSNNISNSNVLGNNINRMDEELNIDDMIKKIDARIAELEAEEKADNEARNNEAKASEKSMIEDANIPLSSNDSISSDVIMPSKKIDFTSFENPSVNVSTLSDNNHDLMDDYLEDLSFDDEPIKVNDVSLNNQVEKKPELVNNTNNDLYTNKEEIDKIMNKNEKEEDDDFFDEFFE